MPAEPPLRSEFQAFVAGLVFGSISKVAEATDVTIEWPDVDEHGAYRPWVDIIGNRSGQRIRISVEEITP